MRVSSLATLLLVLAMANGARAAERTVVVATAPVAGVYYPAGGALCRVVNAGQARHGLRCLVESTDGSRDNLRRLRAGAVDFALVQSDWQYYAGQGGDDAVGGDSGNGGAGRTLRAVASLHAQPFTLLARPQSGIGSVDDLAGKRVNLGPNGSAQRMAGEALIEALGWSKPEFAAITGLDAEQQVDAPCTGQIDAFLISTSHPNSLISAATDRCQARLIPIDGEAVDILLASWPFYARAEISGGLYRANPDPVPTFGLRATLVTTRETPDDTVYWIARSLFEQLDAVRRQHPALAQLSSQDMLSRGNTLQLHDGALRYYRERGWK